jgi:hypothetical protein
VNPTLLHLTLVMAGVLVALGAAHYYARVTGGLWSLAGLLLMAFLVIAGLLVLAGFAVVPFPGLGAS